MLLGGGVVFACLFCFLFSGLFGKVTSQGETKTDPDCPSSEISILSSLPVDSLF